MIRYLISSFSFFCLSLFVPQHAHALLGCSVSALPMSFVAYNPASGSDRDASTSVTVSCIDIILPNTPYELTLSSGGSGDINNREMSSIGTSDTLAYQIYTDATYTQVWGDNTTGVSISGTVVSLLVTGADTQFIYGRIPGGQFVESGIYSDNLIITVTY